MRFNTIKMLGLATLLAVAASSVVAQDNDRPRRNRDGEPGGGRNFDPNEFRQRILERTRERLEVTDDAEWKALEPLIIKVTDARRAVEASRFGRMGGRGGPGGPGGGFGQQQPNPAADALERAIEAKASNAETKAALEKYLADRKAKQAALEKAQADLRKVLTPRQEAIATLNGLL